MQTDRQIDRQIDRHADRQTDRQTCRQIDRHADRHADSINLIPKKMKTLSYHYIFNSNGVISINKIKFSYVT